MIISANRIPVAKGFEEEFENKFKNRAKLVDKRSGFVKNEVLRPINSEYYVILTYWKTMDDYTSWTESEDFAKAHSTPPKREMFSGRNISEIHEVI